MMRESSKVRRLGSVVMLEDRGGSVMVSTGLGELSLPDTLITAGSVRSAMDDLMRHAQHLNDDITEDLVMIVQNNEGQRFNQDWIVWYGVLTQWYQSHQGTWGSATAYLTGETVANLRSKAAEYNQFEQRYETLTGHTPTYNPTPNDSNSWLGLPVAAWVGIGAGVVALGFVAWTANSAAKFAAPVRALRGRRRR
jgi:hypothetical protein